MVVLEWALVVETRNMERRQRSAYKCPGAMGRYVLGLLPVIGCDHYHSLFAEEYHPNATRKIISAHGSKVTLNLDKPYLNVAHTMSGHTP